MDHATAVILTILAMIVTSLGIVYMVRRKPHRFFENLRLDQISAFGTVIVVFLTTVVVFNVGTQISINNALWYFEWWNGEETEVSVHTVTCHPGRAGDNPETGKSNCTHSYRTGQTYWYKEKYTESCTDVNGKAATCKRTRDVEADIYAPQAHHEHRYTITDSFDDVYTFRNTYVNPDDGYNGRPIPDNIPSGQPADWLNAKHHLAIKDPRSTTKLVRYKNYILAGATNAFREFSGDVDHYKQQNLLPPHTQNIMDNPLYGPTKRLASKMTFVGDVKPSDESEWQQKLMKFNTALGMELEGDLHIVAIDANKISSDESRRYKNALLAYWQSEEFGRRAFAKNGIVVILGVDKGKVVWAESDTAMSLGNGAMNESIMSAVREQQPPFTPAAILGYPRVSQHERTSANHNGVTVQLSNPQGLLETEIFEENPFVRTCMECDDPEEVKASDNPEGVETSEGAKNAGHGGYTSLRALMQASTGALITMIVLSTTLMAILFLAIMRIRQYLYIRRSSDVARRTTPSFTHF